MFTDLDPSADPRLAAVFAAARAPAELPLAGEPEARAAYRRSQGKSWFSVRLGARSARLIAAALFGGVVVAGGVATAATGTLPLVGGHHHSPATVHATGQDGEVDTTPATRDETADPVDLADSGPGTDGHPAAQPTLGSVAKGAATCTAASHGTCQAGRHGKAAQAHSHVVSARGGASTQGSAHRPAPASRHGLGTATVHPGFVLRRTH